MTVSLLTGERQNDENQMVGWDRDWQRVLLEDLVEDRPPSFPSVENAS